MAKTLGRQFAIVAPRAGAWIETYSGAKGQAVKLCRPPCGGVD